MPECPFEELLNQLLVAPSSECYGAHSSETSSYQLLDSIATTMDTLSRIKINLKEIRKPNHPSTSSRNSISNFQSSCDHNDRTDDSASCTCFCSWSKANNRVYLRNELKKAFATDENIPFQMVTQDKSVVTVCHVGKMLMNRIMINHSSSSSNCFLELGKYQNIINELRTCWRRRHQHRPFKDVISWMTNFIQTCNTIESSLPIHSLLNNFETLQFRAPQNIPLQTNSSKIRIFIGLSKENVLKHLRNIVLIALHSLVSSQTNSVHVLLGEENFMYWIKIEFKKSLKKAVVNLIKYELHQLEHLCALFVEMWKLMDSVKSLKSNSEDCPSFELVSQLVLEMNDKCIHNTPPTPESTCETIKSKGTTLTKSKQELLKRTREILQTMPQQPYSCRAID